MADNESTMNVVGGRVTNGPSLKLVHEFAPIYKDGDSELRVRLVSRDDRLPTLEIRWWSEKQGWSAAGISVPLKCLESMKLTLSAVIAIAKEITK